MVLGTMMIIDRQSKKIMITLIGRIGIETKTKLSPIISLLLIISLKPRFSRKISIMKTVKEAI